LRWVQKEKAESYISRGRNSNSEKLVKKWEKKISRIRLANEIEIREGLREKKATCNKRKKGHERNRISKLRMTRDGRPGKLHNCQKMRG